MLATAPDHALRRGLDTRLAGHLLTAARGELSAPPGRGLCLRDYRRAEALTRAANHLLRYPPPGRCGMTLDWTAERDRYRLHLETPRGSVTIAGPTRLPLELLTHDARWYRTAQQGRPAIQILQNWLADLAEQQARQPWLF